MADGGFCVGVNCIKFNVMAFDILDFVLDLYEYVYELFLLN